MTQVRLEGVRAGTLAGYLQGLGLLRLLSRQTGQHVRLHWSAERDEAVLSCESSTEELIDWLVDDYAPSAVVTPWNAGSGFAANGKSPAAEKALQILRDSSEGRFAVLRRTILAADKVVAEGRERGWVEKQWWSDTRKRDVVQLCRNTFPDESLAWLDVAVTLTGEDVAYNPLTGTGGNFGRQDLSATYFQRLAQIIGPTASRTRSRDWAEALLHGREDVPYLRDTVGQYDPGRAGGVLSTSKEGADDTGFVNPWAFVLTLEGALLFASAVTRRFRSSSHAAAWPFFVSSTAVGYDSAADEQLKGEQWVPLWEQPASLHDVAQLLGEGRVQWHGHEPRTGLEFALSIASFGVDRGLSAFRRFAIVNRLGQNPLAVPVGRIDVAARPLERMLQQPHDWLQRLKRVKQLPAAVATSLRAAEAAMFEVASCGDAEALGRFVIAFGHLHEAVSRSGQLQEQVPPYRPPGRPEDWLAALPASGEAWVAAGFASLWDKVPVEGKWQSLTARFLLTPVERKDGRTIWRSAAPTGTALTETTLATALAEMHRLRSVHAQQQRTAAKREPGTTVEAEGAGQPFRNGLRLPARLIEAFVMGSLDDRLLVDYLRGLLTLGCSSFTTAEPPPRHQRDPLPVPLALLLPFYAGRSPKEVTLLAERQPDDDADSDGENALRVAPERAVVKPLSPQLPWAAQLMAGQTAEVLRDALLRLRLAGYPPVIGPDDAAYAAAPAGQQVGLRLSAALLLHSDTASRAECVRTTCDVTAVHFRQPESSDDKHESEGTPA